MKQPKAIAYTRVSTDEQGKSGLGLEAQRQMIERAAADLGLPIAEWFDDSGISGGESVAKRPALARALGALGRGDVLIVAKRDRLARSVDIASAIRIRLAMLGARLVSAAGEGTDDDSPYSKAVGHLADLIAELERDLIRARTIAAFQVKRERGEVLGEVPFGYTSEPIPGVMGRRNQLRRRLVPHPAEQVILRALLELRTTGAGYKRIARSLNERGMRPREGEWTGGQVRRIVAYQEKYGHLLPSAAAAAAESASPAA